MSSWSSPGPDDQPVAVGVPYGSRARLILLYLQSEALRTSSREIELGKTLHAWLRRLEIPIGGKAMQVVRDQAERISRCRMSFQIKQGSRTGLVNQNLLDTSMFVEDDATQGTLFLETAILSQQFYDQLRQHPVPVEEAAVRQIANNSLALDIYCWLAYRLHSLREATPVSWRALHGQFGRGVARQDHFRDHFRQVLQLAVSVYPEAQVEEAPGGLGLEAIASAGCAQSGFVGHRPNAVATTADRHFPIKISRTDLLNAALSSKRLPVIPPEKDQEFSRVARD